MSDPVSDPGPLSPSVVPAARAGLTSMPLPDGGLTMYDASSAVAFVMNASAAAVWAHVDGRATLEEIVGELAIEHAADPVSDSDLARDVAGVLGEFRDAGLVDLDDAEAPLP